MQAPPIVHSRKRLGNLPADTTSFLGRRREITELKQLLAESRVVTLTGPGGVGKTRLALRVAAEVRRAFHDRIRFVELAELWDPDLLPETVADQLGLRDQSARAPVDTVIDHLAGTSYLLVLDNCEQIIEACADFVGTLVRSCPELRVLATSRQSLGLLGERVFPVSPFPVPDPDHLPSAAAVEHFESVRLFVERARAVVPDFRPGPDDHLQLTRIIHELDGIPLAIELTAARLRSLSLRQINERLADRSRFFTSTTRGAPPRQRTLRALLDWSYHLCSDREKRLWARASVFSGSFDLDAVEFVAADSGLPADELPDVVDSLLDKSILLREAADGAVRYRMLQTTREYGEQRLAESGELPDVRRRHRDWFAELAARFLREWIGPDQLDWLDMLRRCHPDLRIALAYCAAEPGEAEIGLRMIADLEDYWGIRGFTTECRRWVDRLRAVATERSPALASALRLGGWSALLQGDAESGMAQIAEAGEIAARAADAVEAGYVTHTVGMGALFAGDTPTAIGMLRDALSRFEALGEVRGRYFSRFVLGMALGITGERDAGLAVLERGVADSERSGDEFWRGYVLWSIAHIEVLHGDLDRAESAGRDALRLQWAQLNLLASAFTVDTLAWIAERRRQPARAAELFGVAAQVWRTIGMSPSNYVTFAVPHDEHYARTRDSLGEARFDALFRRGYGLPMAAGMAVALGAKRPPAESPAAGQEQLTRRERQIAELVTAGLTNRDIAARLVISPRTVEAHVEHILVKLGFTSRTQVASWLAAQGDVGQPAGDQG